MAGSAVVLSPHLDCTALLDIVEAACHATSHEWLFLRELRVGISKRNGSVQRLDGFALNSLPHTAMKRVCYEVKTSRSDFLSELKQPLKRRIGMRYSNEFYFVTPAGLADVNEIPAECGLVEAGRATSVEWKRLVQRHAGFFNFNPETQTYCIVRVPAPWRDTPGPTWQLLAAMLRHQRRELSEKPPAPPAQQRLELL
jgi:hypothetical protein